jgi:hypothetical protein
MLIYLILNTYIHIIFLYVLLKSYQKVTKKLPKKKHIPNMVTKVTIILKLLFLKKKNKFKIKYLM